MNRRSPAPKKTPSSANSTPAIGIIPASHGHSTAAWCSTAGSDVKIRGITVCPSASTAANTSPRIAPAPISLRASAAATPSAELPRSRPIRAWAAIAVASRKSAQNVHSCRPICCAASWALPMRAATAGGDRECGEERERAHAQIAGRGKLGADSRPARPKRRSSARQQHQEHEPRRRLGDHVGDGRALDPHAEADDQKRGHPDREHVGDSDHDQGRDRVLKCAHPALRGGHDQDQRRAQRGDSDPLDRLAGRGGVTTAEQVHRGHRGQLDQDDQHHSQARRQPRRLHAHVQGLHAPLGAVQTRCAGGGAVLQERAEPKDL